MQGKYLINTDDWFVAPDGNSYKAAWGDVVIIEDTALGLKTNRNSTNWYAKVGSEDNHIIIAGCQIHYAVRCENKPNIERSEEWQADAANGLKEFQAQTRIYIAQ